MGKTSNEYFYKPELGASGAVEMGKFHDCLDVADAEIKANKDVKHTQGTDQGLDTGGANAVVVADVKDAVTKKHAHANQTELDKLTDGDHDVRTDNPHTVTKTQLSIENVENLKVKLDATEAPGVTNDIDEGYSVGSRWFDVTNDKEYVCLDNTDGAAVWTETTGAGGGGDVAVSGTPEDNDYAKWTAPDTIEGRSHSEMTQDLNPITTVTAVHTMTVAEAGTVLVSCAATPYTITLPTAVGHTGLRYHFIKTDANYFLITLDGDGTETFNYENSTGAPVATYPRLNTHCAAVTVVSDGSNWQCINEKLGLVPKFSVYLGSDLVCYQGTNCPIQVINYDTEKYDIGSNFTIAEWISGNASATTTDHLIDTDTSPFTADMVGKRVKNTTDTTYTYIKTYNSTSDVTLTDDIFVDTEGYQIMYSRFIAPIPGYYQFDIHVGIKVNELEADKGYYAVGRKNGSTLISYCAHSSIAAQPARFSTATLTERLAIDDYINTAFYGNGATDITLQGVAYANFFVGRLIEKD